LNYGQHVLTGWVPFEGQWGPLVGTLFVVFASLGKQWKERKEKEETPDSSVPHCNGHSNTSKLENGVAQVAASSHITITSPGNLTTCGRSSGEKSIEGSSSEIVPTGTNGPAERQAQQAQQAQDKAANAGNMLSRRCYSF
jgi:cytoskeletal protein RodZ